MSRDFSQFRDRPTQELQLTKSGRLSVHKANIDTLLALNIDEDCRDFLKTLLRYKADQKRLTTYVQGLRKHICPDGRVRSSYLLHGTETSRRSSANPNRQNDPTDAEVKRIYVAPPEYLFVVNDYSNLEVRVAAAISQDKNLIQAFVDKRDIHTYVTSMAHRQDYDQLLLAIRNADKYPKEYARAFRLRDHCKRAMWTILFGGGPSKVALLTGLTFDHAAELMNRILTEFPGLKKMFKELERRALDTGRAENAYGRWRPLLGIDSTDMGTRAEAIRQGLNTPIQGTAADITLTAARHLNRWLEKLADKLGEILAYLVQEVHDSLVDETHFSCAESVIVNSKRIMEAVKIPGGENVPLVVDQVIGCHLGSRLKVTDAILGQLRRDPEQLYHQLRADLNYSPQHYERRE